MIISKKSLLSLNVGIDYILLYNQQMIEKIITGPINERTLVELEEQIDSRRLDEFLNNEYRIIPDELWRELAYRENIPPLSPELIELSRKLREETSKLRTISYETDGEIHNDTLPAPSDLELYINASIHQADGIPLDDKTATSVLTDLFIPGERDKAIQQLETWKIGQPFFIPIPSIKTALINLLVLVDKYTERITEIKNQISIPSNEIPIGLIQEAGIYELHLQYLQELARTFAFYLLITTAREWELDSNQDSIMKTWATGFHQDAERISMELAAELTPEAWMESMYAYLAPLRAQLTGANGEESTKLAPAIELLQRLEQSDILGNDRRTELDRTSVLAEADNKGTKEKKLVSRIRSIKQVMANLNIADSLPVFLPRVSSKIKERNIQADKADKCVAFLLQEAYRNNKGQQTYKLLEAIQKISSSTLERLLELYPESEELRILKNYCANLEIPTTLTLSQLNIILSISDELLTVQVEDIEEKTDLEKQVNRDMNAADTARFFANMITRTGHKVVITREDLLPTIQDPDVFKIAFKEKGSFSASSAQRTVYIPSDRIMSLESAISLYAHEVMVHMFSAERVKDFCPILENTSNSTPSNEAAATVAQSLIQHMVRRGITELDFTDPDSIDVVWKAMLKDDTEKLRHHLPVEHKSINIPLDWNIVPSDSIHVLAIGLYLGYDRVPQQRRSALEVFEILTSALYAHNKATGVANPLSKAVKSIYQTGVMRKLRGNAASINDVSYITFKDMVYAAGDYIKAQILSGEIPSLAGLTIGKVGTSALPYQELFGLYNNKFQGTPMNVLDIEECIRLAA